MLSTREQIESCGELDTYEEGILTQEFPVRKRWWQVWLPKTMSCDVGRYTRIGKYMNLTVKFPQLNRPIITTLPWDDE